MPKSKRRAKDVPADAALEAAKALMRGWAGKGGKARAKRLTAEERREIARKAARARWGKRSGRRTSD